MLASGFMKQKVSFVRAGHVHAAPMMPLASACSSRRQWGVRAGRLAEGRDDEAAFTGLMRRAACQ